MFRYAWCIRFAAVAAVLFIQACTSDTRRSVKNPRPKADTSQPYKYSFDVSKPKRIRLVTGWYHVTSEKPKEERILEKTRFPFDLNPKPFLTASGIAECQVHNDTLGSSILPGIKIRFNERGLADYNTALGQSLHREIALVADDKLIIVARNEASNIKGTVSISLANYNEDELENLAITINEEARRASE